MTYNIVVICNEALYLSSLVSSLPLRQRHHFLFPRMPFSSPLLCWSFTEVSMFVSTMIEFSLCVCYIQASLKQRPPLVLRNRHKIWCLQSVLTIILCCQTSIVGALDVSVMSPCLHVWLHICENKKNAQSQACWSLQMGLSHINLVLSQGSMCTICVVEADSEVSLAFSLHRPFSPHAAASVVWLVLYAQGSFVSKYTMHGLPEKIFLHYNGDLNCLWLKCYFFLSETRNG